MILDWIKKLTGTSGTKKPNFSEHVGTVDGDVVWVPMGKVPEGLCFSCLGVVEYYDDFWYCPACGHLEDIPTS